MRVDTHKMRWEIVHQYGTQEAFSKAVGIDPMTISRMCTGKSCLYTTIRKCCDKLGCRPDDMIVDWGINAD